jgi:hypothetical protein
MASGWQTSDVVNRIMKNGAWIGIELQRRKPAFARPAEDIPLINSSSSTGYQKI